MSKKAANAPTMRKRPYPPMFDDTYFKPAPEVLAWIDTEILAEGGALHNPDHKHLLDADLGILWAADGYASKMRTVVGTAEQVAFRCSAWQKLRQEEQMVGWFGRVPDFVITLDAKYAANAPDIAWCALVEHELYHIAHVKGAFDEPMFTKDGKPKLGIQSHDVEEFVGVVRRYGTGHPEGALARLVAAAKSAPEVSNASLSGACGTCLRLVA